MPRPARLSSSSAAACQVLLKRDHRREDAVQLPTQLLPVLGEEARQARPPRRRQVHTATRASVQT